MSTPWYEEPKGQKHKKLYDYLTTLESRQAYRERENVMNLGLAEDREIMGVAPGLYIRPSNGLYSNDRVSLNITGALCDTAQNYISQTKPLPMALTEGGDWLMQQKAQDLNKLIEGEFYGKKIFETMQDAFGDCTKLGTGVIYVDREDKDVIVERVFPNEIIVDDALCEFSPPWEMTRRKYIARDKLKRMFPNHKKEIESAKPVKLSGTTRSTNYQVDLVPVYMTWRLPMKKRRSRRAEGESETESTGGVAITIIETCTLQEKPFQNDDFPFVFIRWRKPSVGFFGRGIPSLGYKIQIDINKTVRNHSKAVGFAVPRLNLPTGSNINTEHISNEIGSGIWHAPGSPPSWLQGQMIPPEGMSYLQFLVAQYYQLIGISELAAGMKKPSGLNSGEAQRVYADTQSDRFALPSQQYENASLAIAERILDAIRDISDYEVTFDTGKTLRRIVWNNIDLAKEEYTLKLSPINYLSKDPAEMMDQVNDLIQQGRLTTKQANKLTMFPDLEAVMDIENASDNLTQKIIEMIVEDDNLMPPDPAMDLEDAIKTVQLSRLHYKTLGLPANKLKMLDNWVAQAIAMLSAAAPAPGPTPGAGPAGLPPPAPTMSAPPVMAAA